MITEFWLVQPRRVLLSLLQGHIAGSWSACASPGPPAAHLQRCSQNSQRPSDAGVTLSQGRTLPLLNFWRLLSAHISSLARSPGIANIFCKHAERQLWHIIHSLIIWLSSNDWPQYGSPWNVTRSQPSAGPSTLNHLVFNIFHFLVTSNLF